MTEKATAVEMGMNDREKVISQCKQAIDSGEPVTDYNFYYNILNLLKEQEASEPWFKPDDDGIFVWCCGSCGAYMYHVYDGIDKAKEYAKFCRQCGRPVKWE